MSLSLTAASASRPASMAMLSSDRVHPMKTAHELARREMASTAGRAFYGTYRKCFADQLRAVYASLRAAPITTGFVSVGATHWD